MSSARRSGTDLLLVLVVSVAVAGYMLVRFGGVFASNDVGTHSIVAASIKATGSLTAGATYSNGFGYPALIALLSSLTGVSIAVLQTYVMPLFLFVPVAAAYVLARNVLGERPGTFAAVLVLIYPFFLFSAFRSTHEKFTYALILLAIYFLYVSFETDSFVTKTRAILTGYLTISGIVFLNIYFASALITAVGMSLAGAFVLSTYYSRTVELRRLAYTVGTSFSFLLVFLLFVYPPAQKFLLSIDSVSVQTFVLLFGSGPSAGGGASNPYASLFVRWRSFTLYLVLVSVYFVVYPLGGLSWLASMRSVLARGLTDDERVGGLFILLLAAAFGFLLVGAIVVDLTGLLGANMRLRVFPLLGFMAIILATGGVFAFLGSERDPSVVGRLTGDVNVSRLLRRRVVPVVIVLLLIGFSGTAVLKATNDPAVSNVWAVTTQDERATVNWTETHLRDEYLWSGYTPRLRNDQRIHHPERNIRNRYDLRAAELGVQYVIMSETIGDAARSINAPLPPHGGGNVIYSNGDAAVYWFERYRTFEEYNDAFEGR